MSKRDSINHFLDRIVGHPAKAIPLGRAQLRERRLRCWEICRESADEVADGGVGGVRLVGEQSVAGVRDDHYTASPTAGEGVCEFLQCARWRQRVVLSANDQDRAGDSLQMGK